MATRDFLQTLQIKNIPSFTSLFCLLYFDWNKAIICDRFETDLNKLHAYLCNVRICRWYKQTTICKLLTERDWMATWVPADRPIHFVAYPDPMTFIRSGLLSLPFPALQPLWTEKLTVGHLWSWLSVDLESCVCLIGCTLQKISAMKT